MPTLTHGRPPQTMKARNRRIGAAVSELLIGPDGRVQGVFQPSRIRPRFMERLRVAGIVLPPSTFERETQVP